MTMYDNQTHIAMETRAVKKQTSFRLDEGLLGRLKEEAKKANRTLTSRW